MTTEQTGIKLHPRLLEALREDIPNPPAVLLPSGRMIRQIREMCGERFGICPEPPLFVGADWVTEQARPLLYRQGKTFLADDRAFWIWEEALVGLPQGTRNMIAPEFFIEDEARTRLIQRAAHARHSLHQHCAELSADHFSSAESRMGEFFYRWASAYLEICRQRKLADSADVERILKDALSRGATRLPPSLWVGFTLPLPSLRVLYELIGKAGGKCEKLDSAFVSPNQRRTVGEYPNEKAELFGTARMVAKLHAEMPDRRIGVVIPDLENQWRSVRRVFAEAMRPETAVSSADLPFDISWGEAHNSYPLVGDLLALLETDDALRPLESFLHLFVSPYLRGHAAERVGRSRLKDRLLNLSESHRYFRLSRLAKKTDSDSRQASSLANCKLLCGVLRSYLAVPHAFAESASPAAWAEIFMKQTRALGWGAEVKWSSREVQVWDKWLRVMDNLYAAGSVREVCSRRDALLFLRRQTDEVFQPRLRSSARVHLLSINSARGLGFDDLFLCRMHEHALARPQPNFFVPYKLARVLGMPWASREHRQRADEDLLRQLGYAEDIRISYAATADGEEKSIHPLLLPAGTEIARRENEWHGTYAPQDFEELEDICAPPVHHEKELKGGLIALVKEQAACPFRAFAMVRLGIKTPPSLVRWVTPQQRGSLLHALLRNIWEDLADLKTLREITDEELSARIDKSATALLIKSTRRLVFLRDEMIRTAEKRFLTEMAEMLLLWEKHERSKGFDVDLLEEKTSAGVRELPPLATLVSDAEGGSRFELRVDRMDVFEKGKLLIDYKTSRNISSANLRGARPREPQLIIYSLALKDIKGFGFVSFSLREGVKTDGYAMFDNELFPVSPTKDAGQSPHIRLPKKTCLISPAELEKMQLAVKNLLAEHLRGQAAVDPREAADCRYCGYASLCRIGESAKIMNDGMEAPANSPAN